MDEIAKNLARIKERIAEAAHRSGRSPEDVSLVGVSKTQPVDAIQRAVDAGQYVFGENRVLEALGKAPALPKSLTWHLIGHLQTNKIRKALGLFQLLHGVDSLHLAQAIHRIAADMGVSPRILLEVNVSGEKSKFGFSPDNLMASLEEIVALEHIKMEGLMTMAPFHPDPENARPFFAKLRELRDQLSERTYLPLSVLSMGMSGDYQVAIEEGATLVRIGSALFGSRRLD